MGKFFGDYFLDLMLRCFVMFGVSIVINLTLLYVIQFSVSILDDGMYLYISYFGVFVHEVCYLSFLW